MAKAVHKKKREILAPARTGKYTVAAVTRVIEGVHVLRQVSGRWVVNTMGTHSVTKTFSKKDAAVACAKEIAKGRNGVVYVHRSDGKVEKQKASA